MTVPKVKLATLQQSLAIVDSQARPTPAFLRFVNGAITSLKNGVNAVIDAQNAAAAATAAAAVATAAAAAATSATAASSSEQSLVNSGLEGFTPPAITGNAAGTVVIANHNRRYGNSTLNPTVAVTGGSFPSGFAPGDTVYIFYDDPTRAGGAVTYQFSTDPADAVQGGVRHSVGSVVLPASGTVDGTPVLPPGIT